MAKLMHFSIYETMRCYGGPEEGGWYYDDYTLIASIPIKINFRPCFRFMGKDYYPTDRRFKIVLTRDSKRRIEELKRNFPANIYWDYEERKGQHTTKKRPYYC